MFLVSKCRADWDLGLCTTSGLTFEELQRNGKIQFFLRLFSGSRNCAAVLQTRAVFQCLLFSVWFSCLLYIFFLALSFFLNLGVFINCWPQKKHIFGRVASGGASAERDLTSILVRFRIDVSDVPFCEKRGKYWSLWPKIFGDFGLTPVARGCSRAKAPPLATRAKLRKTPRSQALASYGPKKGEEEDTHRHTVKTHVEKHQTGSWLTYANKEEGREASRERIVGSQ